MTRTVLITGANGYVGGRVSQALLAQTDVHLRLAVRPGTATRAPSPRVEVVEWDLGATGSFDEACRGVDAVLHLAALNHADSEKRPRDAWVVNTIGTQSLLRAAEASKVERFVYLSTAHVYGSPLRGTLTEASPTRPASLYAMTHRAAEDMVLAAHDRKAITGTVLRLSNALGAPADARANAWMLIANDLCRQAVTTDKMTLRSSGLQVRDFVPLSDVVRAFEHAFTLSREELGDGLFNLSGERTLRMIDLAERIAERCAKLFGSRPEIVRPAPSPHESSPTLNLRMDKLKATGFRLEGSLDAEIDATLQLCQRAFGA